MSKEQRYQNIHLDNGTLEVMCKYLITDNPSIKRKQLVNIQEIINLANPETYENDKDKKDKIHFIRKAIEARMDYNLSNPELILKHINRSLENSNNFSYSPISSQEIIWLDNMISETLQYGYLYNNVDDMMDICTRFKNSDFGDKKELADEFIRLNADIQNNIRKIKNDREIETSFSLRDGAMEDSIYEIHKEYTSPRNLLLTGMQGFNEMLGGGFEAGRLYVLFGLPGEGKSALLLNLAYQIKKYNRYYKPKDQTKTPCIVLLTMENKVAESVSRLFSIISDNDSMKKHTPKEVVDIMRDKGDLVLNDESPIDIIIRFKPTNSVSTNYLYELTDDLEDDGYEVICFIQDYIGRIRSTEFNPDLRIEYGKVTDEFKVFANIKNIPVISAAQLNREASKHIDEGRQRNKADLVRTIGRTNISESIQILNNIDAGFVLAPEVTRTGDRYMGIQRIKIRYEASKLDYAYFPFKKDSTIALVEDYGLAEPLYKTTLMDNNGMNIDRQQSPYMNNSIKEVSDLLVDDEPSLFNNSASTFGSSTEDFLVNYNSDSFTDIGPLELIKGITKLN